MISEALITEGQNEIIVRLRSRRAGLLFVDRFIRIAQFSGQVTGAFFACDTIMALDMHGKTTEPVQTPFFLVCPV